MDQKIITFTNTGLNYDDDLLALPDGDSRYRLNVVLTEDGNVGVLVNAQKRVLKSISLPSGTNKIIGFIKNNEDSTGIYALYNSNNNHSFLEYNVSSDTVTYLLDGTDGSSPTVGEVLNFPDGYVDMGIIGSGDKKYLIWTDGTNEPRYANITMMRNYTNGSGTPIYTSINSEVIALYKKPLISGLTTSYVLYGSYDGNNLKGKLFQFSMRKRYYDNTYTTLSAYSDIPIPQNEDMATGRLSDEEKNNAIVVQFSNEDDDLSVVDYYQLLYRIVDIGDGSVGNWYIYENYSYTSTGIKSIYFLNEKNLGTVSSDDAARPFDYVPLISNHVEIIDSNRIVLDVGLEGYNNIDYTNSSEWNVTLEELTAEAITSNGIAYYNDSLLNTANETASFTFTDIDQLDYSYYMFITTDDPVGEFSYFFNSSYGFDNDYILDIINTSINAKSYSELSSTYTPATNILLLTHAATTTYNYYARLYVYKTSGKINTLKAGASYKFGLRYGFNGRYGYVQTNEDLILTTSNIGDVTPTVTHNGYITEAQLTISHLPPEGATDYQVVYLGNNIEKFEDYFCQFNGADISDDSDEYDLYHDGINTIIKSNNIATRFREAYSKGITYGFEYQVGDFVRLIGTYDGGENDTELFDNTWEYEITSIDSSTIRISSAAASKLDELYSGENFVHIQIIRYRDDFGNENGVYQEIGKVYPITSGGYHTGNKVNGGGTIYQDATYPAILKITSDFSDVWKSYQVFVNPENSYNYYSIDVILRTTWMELDRVSLYYDSTITSWGRVNTVNESAIQSKRNEIRFSGKYFESYGGVNYISKFDYDDVRSLDEKHGDIIKMHQFGSTLRIFQERKVTTFYLGAISSVDTDGNLTVTSSSDVMDTSGRQFIEEIGCTHFSSFDSTIRTEYFFDLNNAAVIRGSANGLEIISDYKMHKFFEGITKRILQDAGISNVRISGGFNKEYDMYMITFYDTRGTNNDDINYTLGFNETINRWISFYDYYPEYYGHTLGNYNLSFNSGNTYLDFNNDREDSIVRVHCNANSEQIKIWNAIIINSINQWVPYQNGDVMVNIPIEMQSRLKAGRFKLQEGEYRTEFLKDLLSGYSTAQEKNLFNGRELRGYDISVDLRYEDLQLTLGSNLVTNSGYEGTTDWVDSNADGTADGWYLVGGLVGYIFGSGYGFEGNSQGMSHNYSDGGAPEYSSQYYVRFTYTGTSDIMKIGKRYKISFKARVYSVDSNYTGDTTLTIYGINSNSTLYTFSNYDNPTTVQSYSCIIEIKDYDESFIIVSYNTTQNEYKYAIIDEVSVFELVDNKAILRLVKFNYENSY